MNRQYHLPLVELIDRMTLDQIKECLQPKNQAAYAEEIRKLEHDIDLLLQEKKTQCSARLLRLVMLVGQMNVHIWYLKDLMALQPGKYHEHLKLAHQLNGVKNQVKNALLAATGDATGAVVRTNTQVDGLEGWNVSI